MSDRTPTLHIDLVEWYREQRANVLKNIEIIDRGHFRVGTDERGSPIKDENPELRATYARIYEQMGRLLEKYRNHYA